jgi:DNA-binding response OmpR family regulator
MPHNVTVLLVDDNPMILGMLKQALGQIAHITTATDAPDALLKAVDSPPDILISDYRMTGMDGRQLVEKLRARPATMNVAVILLATKADIAERLNLERQVDEFIEKPFYLREATQRIKRVIDKIALEKMARSAPAEGGLRGNLAQMNVIDLMQSLEMGRKSCLLTFTHAGERCDVYIVDGQISHASYGAIKGDAAVFKVLTWEKGNFQIDFEGRSSEQTITRSTQGLMMEGLRILDESRRHGEGTQEGNQEDVLLDS